MTIIEKVKAAKKKHGAFIVVLVLSVSFLVIACFGCYHTNKRNYQHELNNPPTINYIEEDLEDVFMSRSVSVVEYEKQGQFVVVIIKANGLLFKGLYSIHSTGFPFTYCWVFDKYIVISGEDV